jgi:epsilon-lactone hydrolase
VASEALQQIIDATPVDFPEVTDHLMVRARMAPLHGRPTEPSTRIEFVEMGGIRCAWVSAKEAAAGALTIFFCHGGAFVSCDLNAYLFYAELISRQLKAPVLTVDYRLAPEHRYPAALDDCFAAYRGLLASGQDPARLIGIGDSCGGGLAIAVLYRARDAGLPMPAGVVSLCGWLVLDTSGYAPEYAAARDPFVSVGWVLTTSRAYVGPEGDLTDPYVSPGHGDPTGLPPLLLQVGEVDVNRRDTEAFALRARMAGVLATLDLTVGAVHGFQGIESVPEAVEAWGRAAAFVARCTTKG